jgi:hypothetical protein
MATKWQSCHLATVALSEILKLCGPFFQQAYHSPFFVLPLGNFLPQKKG